MQIRCCTWCQRTSKQHNYLAWKTNTIHLRCYEQMQCFLTVELPLTSSKQAFKILGNKHNPYGRHGKPMPQSD